MINTLLLADHINIYKVIMARQKYRCYMQRHALESIVCHHLLFVRPEHVTLICFKPGYM